MNIPIEDILEEGLIVDVDEPISIDRISLVSPVKSHLELRKIGREIVIEGFLKAEIEYQCSRCLKTFRTAMEIPVETVYHPVDDMHSERKELKNDEMDMSFYSGDKLDVQELLKEQIVLNVQMKPLCDDNCKGLCSQCGKDLSLESCSCSKKEADPRLAVLKKLLDKGKE